MLLGGDNELKNFDMLIGYKDDKNDSHATTNTSSNDIQPSLDNVKRFHHLHS